MEVFLHGSSRKLLSLLFRWKKMKKKKRKCVGSGFYLVEKRIRCLYSVGRLGLKVGVKGRNSP